MLNCSWCVGTPLCFSAILAKGNNFHDSLFTSSKGVVSSRKEFAPRGANSFLKELTPNETAGKNED